MNATTHLLASLDLQTLVSYPETLAVLAGLCLTVWMGLGVQRMRGWAVANGRSQYRDAPEHLGTLAVSTRTLLSDLEDVAGREGPAYVRREIWQWVGQAEAVASQFDFSELGLSLEAIRTRLLADSDQPAAIRALIGMLRVFDQRLCAPRGDHYRGHAGVRAKASTPSAGIADVVARKKVYEQLIRLHGPGLRRVAGSYTRTASERDDLFQDISLALWRALANFRGEASLRTFAYRVAHNRAVTHSTRRRPTPAQADTCRMASADASPEQALDRAEKRRRLQEAIVQLPVGQRQVLTLALEGFRHAQIAEVVGISEKNVSVRLSRARQKLAQSLGGTAR